MCPNLTAALIGDICAVSLMPGIAHMVTEMMEFVKSL